MSYLNKMTLEFARNTDLWPVFKAESQKLPDRKEEKRFGTSLIEFYFLNYKCLSVWSSVSDSEVASPPVPGTRSTTARSRRQTKRFHNITEAKL